MKLTLPLALLTALLACMPVIAAEEGTTTVLNPTDGGVTNSGGNYYLSQDVTWEQDYNYDKSGTSTVLSVGTMYGAGSLSVENASNVNVAGSLHIGGWGWGTSHSDVNGDAPHDGYVYVGEGSSVVVGADVNVDASNSQLNVGAGAAGQGSAKGTLVVDGGTVTTNAALNVGLASNGVGEVVVKNGGQVIVQCGAKGYTSSSFNVGYYGGSSGTVTVEGEGSALLVGAKDGGYAMTYLGLGDSSGVLEVKDGATADLSTSGTGITALGYDAAGSGTIRVTDATLIASEARVGYAGDGELSMSSHSVVTLEGTTYVACAAGSTGTITVDDATTVNLEGETYLGYNSGTATMSVSEGSTADFGKDVYIGGWNGAQGELTVSGNSTVNLEGQTYLGYSNSEGTMSIGDGSTVDFGDDVILGGWNGSSGELAVSGGADVSVSGNLLLGYTAGSSGTVKVDGAGTKLSVASEDPNVSTQTGVGVGTFEVTNGATAELQELVVYQQGSVSVSEGSDVSVTGDMVVAQGASVTVADGATATSSLTVDGEYTNDGTTNMNLSKGGSFSAGSVSNNGTMNVTLDEEGSFSVGSYVNNGNSTITATEGTTCQLGTLQMESGSMQLEGEGSFVLGAATTSGGEPIVTTFTVTGESAEAATSTCIDIASLGSANFTINTESTYTFRFTDEIKAALVANLYTDVEMTLTVVKGYEGFLLEELERDRMLANTSYDFGNASSATTYALAAVSSAYGYVVSDAEYVMDGNNLVWRGKVRAVPEPATATLSLLALAALAARRRRS